MKMNGTGVWGSHGMMQTEEDLSIPRKLVPIAQKKSPTWAEPLSNSSLRYDRPATNPLKHDILFF
jgi:hypothetical protein